MARLLTSSFGCVVRPRCGNPTATVLQRPSNSGRKPARRTISRALLLQGLEFDYVAIADASHFARERLAQAKLFYVAILRSTSLLTIASENPVLRLSTP